MRKIDLGRSRFVYIQTVPLPTRTYRLLLGLVLLLGCLHIAVHYAPFEDAYITYRYAENWAHGHGPVYNPGERVEGATSLGWTFILAVIARAGLPLETSSRFLSAFCGLMLAMATIHLARRALRVSQTSGWLLVAAMGVVASGTFAYYAGSGMETTLFATGVTLSAAQMIGDGSRRGLRITGALLAVTAMIRPEGVG